MIRIIKFYDRSHTKDNPQYLGLAVLDEEHVEDGYIETKTGKVYYRDQEVGSLMDTQNQPVGMKDWHYMNTIISVRIDEDKLEEVLNAVDLELNPQSSARDIAEEAFEEGYKSEKIKSLIAKIENTHDLDPAVAINACNELLDVLKDKYKKFIS